MRQLLEGWLMRILSAVVAAIPFLFGAIRALQTGSDFRYLAAALAALAAAATVFRLGASRARGTTSRTLLPLLALSGATLLAGAVAFGLGATSSAAVWVVAFAFGLCVTAGGTLGLFTPSRSRQAG
jgi:hypothetical protein